MNLFETIKCKILEKQLLLNKKEIDVIFKDTNFFEIHGDEFLKTILAENFSEDQYDVIHAYSWFVFAELGGRNFGESAKYEIPPRYCKIQEFIYEWDIFGSKRIPWDEWSDIAQEGLEVLKNIINSNYDDYKKTSGYNDFMDKVSKRLSKIVKDRKYDHEFQEWGKDG